MLASILAVLALAQAPGDTIPLPPLDTAYTILQPVRAPAELGRDTIDVWLQIDSWGFVDEVRPVHEIPNEKLFGYIEHTVDKLIFLPPRDGTGWVRLRTPLALDGDIETSGDTRRPEIRDRDEAQQVVSGVYPRALRNAEVGGRVTVDVRIDEQGEVLDSRLRSATGNRLLNEAAERAAFRFDFTPALNRGEPVSVWVSIPITFSAGGTQLEAERVREFTLGSGDYPVAPAEPISAASYPDMIRPDKAYRRLSRAYLRDSPENPLSLVVQMDLSETGEIMQANVLEEFPSELNRSKAIGHIVRAIRSLRFRPSLRDGEALHSSFTARFSFAPEVGLIPTVPIGSCRGTGDLVEGPTFTPVDTPAERATPVWERERLLQDNWPLILRDQPYAFRVWLLIDEKGRPCKVIPLKKDQDPWVISKVRRIMKSWRFRPATRNGAPVAHWRQDMLETASVSASGS